MYEIKFNQSEKEYKLSTKEGDIFIEDEKVNWDISKTDHQSFHIIYKNKTFTAHVDEIDYDNKTFKLQLNGKVVELELKDKMDLLLEEMGISDMDSNQVNDVKAPMPGLIIDIMVAPGDEVKKGDPLLILEAMKMENVIKAEGDGTISEIKANKGDSVEKNQLIIQF
ncbi:acetyl-CoA carboxylase biotin carboxyl carrier protein subunit [Marivirga arenosa]|uniref:Biotin/lipoyl-containing protein n=1 Tax=Marivirga arenosa TaxID=3059076 RepID=A0AA49GJF6_9BACT|nr:MULTISPECIES: biotin/lipoyl-containing protein [unclassified Marivirga]WKK81964.1 biotin/lipoyl-containing protein [Marivirga sp. BKB1-2]WMN07372.1 biotin/lipoyl-containing protein [Marivirga sp. ABR2-2]